MIAPTVREFIAARLDEIGAAQPWPAPNLVHFARPFLAEHRNEQARTTVDCRASECCWDGCLVTYCEGCGQIVDESLEGACDWLLRLAAIWSDHPDYQDDWKVADDA